MMQRREERIFDFSASAKSNCYPGWGSVVPKGCYPLAFVRESNNPGSWGEKFSRCLILDGNARSVQIARATKGKNEWC